MKPGMDVGQVLTKRHLFRNAAPAKFDAAGRPDFLCIGAQKAGTSWLYRQLTEHPDFWMPPVKGLHYFNLLGRVPSVGSARARDDRDRRFLEAIKRLSVRSHLDLEDYAGLFAVKGVFLSGDITPAYSMLNDVVIERI